MRLGVHAFLWARDYSTEALTTAIREAARAKVDFIEIPILHPEEINITALRLALLKHGLPCTCSTVLPPTTSLEDLRKAEEFLLQVIEVVAYLESPILTGVIYSKLGESTPPTIKVLNEIASMLKRVARVAAVKDVHLGIEPVNRYETSILNTAEQALKIIEAISEPNVFLHLDTYHMNIEEQEFRQPILKAGKHLRYVHLSESHRGKPGTGTVQWEDVFSALANAGFDGDMAFESFIAPNPSLSQATRIWRSSPVPAEEIAHEGLMFFREMARKYGLML